jgi:hypothetical protein
MATKNTKIHNKAKQSLLAYLLSFLFVSFCVFRGHSIFGLAV